MVTPYSVSTSRQGLSFLWLEITPKCNLECIHCYADSGPRRHLVGQMRIDDWLTVLSDSADLGCQEVQFIGGEPTLHPDLARMISFASTRGYKFIEVFTNATNVNDGLLNVFLKHTVHVAISFYSDDPETHERVTKRRGSFARTVEGVKRMLAAGLSIRAGIIETNENAGHAQNARLFLERMGVPEIRVDFQRRVGRGAAGLSSEPMSELCGECWKGKLCVTSSGCAYPCVFSRFAKVGMAKSGITTILADERLTDFRVDLRRYQDQKRIESTDSGTGTPCNPICSPCSPDQFKRCAPPVLDSASPRVLYGAQSAGSGCDPICSPCGPGVFKCAPGRCAPKSSGYSSEAYAAASSACQPDQSSDCGPQRFPKCNPR